MRNTMPAAAKRAPANLNAIGTDVRAPDPSAMVHAPSAEHSPLISVAALRALVDDVFLLAGTQAFSKRRVREMLLGSDFPRDTLLSMLTDLPEITADVNRGRPLDARVKLTDAISRSSDRFRIATGLDADVLTSLGAGPLLFGSPVIPGGVLFSAANVLKIISLIISGIKVLNELVGEAEADPTTERWDAWKGVSVFEKSVVLLELACDSTVTVADGVVLLIRSVPEECTLTIAGNEGTIKIERNLGKIRLSGNDGSVLVEENAGMLDIDANSDTVLVETNTGTIDIDGNSETVGVDDNQGRIEVNSNDDTVAVSENNGTVDIDGNNEQVDIGDNNGTVTVDGNAGGTFDDADVNVADNSDGTVNANNNDGNINVMGGGKVNKGAKPGDLTQMP